MQTIFRLIRSSAVCAVVVAATAVFYGCNKSEPEVTPEGSGFSLGRNVVEVSEEGGAASVPYFIENPQDGVSVEILNGTDYDWIVSFDLSEAEMIHFEVAPLGLETDSREAVINVAYGEEQQSFTVKQAKEDMNPEFNLEITRTSTETIWATIQPTDPDMHFWSNVMETSKFNSFATDEELFEEDVRWFEKIADIYYSGNMETFYWDQFENISYLSPHSMMMSSYNLAEDMPDASLEIQPSTDYTVYCYGMDGEGNRLTRVYSVETRTKDIVTDNQVSYDIEVNVQNQTVYSTITPSDDSQRYFTDSRLYQDNVDGLTEEELRAIAQRSVDSYIFMTFGSPDNMDLGLTVEQIVEGMFPTGKVNGEKPFTYSGRDGVTYAFSIDEEGQIISKAYTEEFHLDTPGQADYEIELSVSDIGPWSAVYSAHPTDDGETYLVHNLEADLIEGWTDEEIMEYLAAKETWYEFAHYGDASEELVALERNTDYVLVAFGYKNATPVTELFKYEYRTLDAPVSDVECNVDVMYFNGDEVLELYPEFGGGLARNVFVYMKAAASDDAVEYHYTMMSDDSYLPFLNDGAPTYVKDFTDDQALYILKGAIGTPTNTGFAVYNASYTLFAVAVDADGNYGPVYREKLVFTREGCLPIDELPALAPVRAVNYVERGVAIK